MRINEYNSLEEFTSQYVGEWGPSDGHYFGLEFRYNGNDYRLHTGYMYADDPQETEQGEEVLFSLYTTPHHKIGSDDFRWLACFASMEDLLKSTCIEGRVFSEVIMDDDTLMLAQD